MGTRADFYIGRGPDAEWLGSVAWDGNPDGVPADLLKAAPATVQQYRSEVWKLLAADDSASVPDHGWPWPWDDSRTTDYAYAFEDGVIWAACFGYEWFIPDLEADNCGEPECEGAKQCVFPDMSRFKNVTFGERSGLMVFGKED